MKKLSTTKKARELLSQGKILAYPTEAVWGIGAIYSDLKAVEKIIKIKARDSKKGLIIIINNWQQLHELTLPVDKDMLKKVASTWPGHVTWLFPKSAKVSDLVSGASSYVAIRMTAHPLAHELCQDFPILSTSANQSGEEPIREEKDLKAKFANKLDAYLPGKLGGERSPSKIFDVLSGKQIR